MRGSLVAAGLVAASLGLTAPGAAEAQAPSAVSMALPEGAGKATAQRLCSQCHTLVSVTHQHHSQEEWNGVISRMLEKGLVASDDELQDVSDYLSRNFGPQKPAVPAPPSRP